MKAVDRLLQRWRIGRARPHLPRGGRVLDIGCADGAMFRQCADVIGEGIGIDPDVEVVTHVGRHVLVPGRFPDALTDDRPFDAITLLAVLEHVPTAQQASLAASCAHYLRPGGRVVITVPAPAVDAVLAVLKTVRLIDGMSVEQHFGFVPEQTVDIFGGAGLTLEHRARFQLGLNNLFVFRKPAA